MTDAILTPSFPALPQRFFVEHLAQHRAVSPRTIAAYRDTFRLLLGFAETAIGKAPTRIVTMDLNAKLILNFLDHLEKDRKNAVRNRVHELFPWNLAGVRQRLNQRDAA